MLREKTCHFLLLFAIGLAAQGVSSADQSGDDAKLVAEVEASAARSVAFLLEHQDSDGAWRSKSYGALKDGPAATALVLNSLISFLDREDVRKTYDKGVDYLAGLVTPAGAIKEGSQGLKYPVYTAAMAVMVLSKKGNERHIFARDAFLAFLKKLQLTEQTGWQASDMQYGGWGYWFDIPVKPKPENKQYDRLIDSNLSATLYAIGALWAAGISSEDASVRKALIFVGRCQNFSDASRPEDSSFNDGGFFCTPTNSVQNKAGVAGKDSTGAERYFSYGTMTADGIRALTYCGLSANDPHVKAAWNWIENNFTATNNPGTFEPTREVFRGATYHYYCWSMAHALRLLRAQNINTKSGSVSWAHAFARQLLSRQRPDGSWTNEYTDAKEDDPLVATSFALATLCMCRTQISGKLSKSH